MMIQAAHALVVVLLGLPLLLYGLRSTLRLSGGHLVAVAGFVFYLLGVAGYTVFPLLLDADYRAEAQQPIGSLVTLVPFFMSAVDVMTRDQAIGNILLGVPFGFGLPFVWRTSLWRVLWAGLLFAASIETIQYAIDALAIAFPLRAVDINDVFLNTFGAALGLLGLVVARRLYVVGFAERGSGVAIWSQFHGVLGGQSSVVGARSTSTR